MMRGLVLPLSHKEDFILGRDRNLCDVILAHEHISKQHAIISYRGGRFFIRDLGALNGTYVNGERVNGIGPLVAGDEIRLPPYMMLFFGPDHAVEDPLVSTKSSPSPGIKTSPGQKTGSITGLLSILSVSDIIQLINFTTQSGVLTVRTPELQIVEVTFLEGEIVQARVADQTGIDAVHTLLGIRNGEFEFVQGSPTPPEDAIQQSTVSLLLEATRLRDEASLTGHLSAGFSS
jgi:pSer/pThr/pTyr-binding forkhead associated (FHA) protein